MNRIRYKQQTIELLPVEQRRVGPLIREKLLGIMTQGANLIGTVGWNVSDKWTLIGKELDRTWKERGT